MNNKHKKQKRPLMGITKKNTKEVALMLTTVSLRESEKVFIREMSEYIENLRLQQEISVKAARKEAKIALIRTGVLTRDGKEKDKIVTWE